MKIGLNLQYHIIFVNINLIYFYFRFVNKFIIMTYKILIIFYF